MYARTTGEGLRLSSDDGGSRESWARAPLKRGRWTATRDAVLFQQMDIDYAVDRYAARGWGRERRSKGDAAVVRMFGVTGDGTFSVCAHVHGFAPYFYASGAGESFGEAECAAFRRRLNEEVSMARKGAQGVHVIECDARSQAIVDALQRR